MRVNRKTFHDASASAESNQEKLGNDLEGNNCIQPEKRFLGVSFTGEYELIFQELNHLKTKVSEVLFNEKFWIPNKFELS